MRSRRPRRNYCHCQCDRNCIIGTEYHTCCILQFQGSKVITDDSRVFIVWLTTTSRFSAPSRSTVPSPALVMVVILFVRFFTVQFLLQTLHPRINFGLRLQKALADVFTDDWQLIYRRSGQLSEVDSIGEEPAYPRRSLAPAPPLRSHHISAGFYIHPAGDGDAVQVHCNVPPIDERGVHPAPIATASWM